MGAAIRLADEPRVNMVTVYCVQAYWADRKKLAAGPFKQFKSEERATSHAVALANRWAGVVVFSVTGCPDADFWQEPKLIVSHGDVLGLQG